MSFSAYGPQIDVALHEFSRLSSIPPFAGSESISGLLGQPFAFYADGDSCLSGVVVEH